MAYKPWFTSNDLIASIKRKVSFPIAQSTFTELDLLAFANEEMQVGMVPSIMIYHEEFFVQSVRVALEANKSRYLIPNRAIGMKMRDLFFEDESGNLREMARVSSEDKAFWSNGAGQATGLHKFYIEGNDVVLLPENESSGGYLVFYIYLRPNQLVKDNRAAVSTAFSKTITCASVLAGDTVTIDDTTLTAGTDFAVGASDAATATNLAAAITASGEATASNGTPATAIVTVSYSTLSMTVSSSNSSRLAVQATQGIVFDQVPTTWTNPDTNVSETLFADGTLIDFLQTKPGHKTLGYDVTIPSGGISGTTINFASADVPSTFIVGDYICLANECIIPQVPPDLHNSLAERTGARLLAAMGDQAGLQASMAKINEIEQKQGTLIDNRVEGSPQKITGRKGLLFAGKRAAVWRG